MSPAPPVPPAHAYHAVHLPEHPARARVWRVIARDLAPWVPPSARVLEVGAGYCHWINAVEAAERVAVDVWPGFAEHAGTGVRALVLDAATGLRSLGEHRFDVVLASNVLEHFEPDGAAALVADIGAVLRPGGRLVVIRPPRRGAW